MDLLRRCNKRYLFLAFCMVICIGLIAAGLDATAWADSQKGKMQGKTKEPVAPKSSNGTSSVRLLQAGTVVQLTDHGQYEDSAQGDWITNSWVVYHFYGDDTIHKTDGVQDIQLTDLNELYYCDSHPDARPDGQWIVFQRNRTGTGDLDCASLWAVDVNGTTETELVPCTDDTGGSQWPKYSPDGKLIAFWHGASGHDYRDVYAVNFPVLGPLKRVTFLQGQPGNDLNWVIDYVATSNRQRLPIYKILTSMNPGRNNEMYPNERDVAKIDLNGGLTWLETRGDDVCSLQSSPMPDGNRVVYMRDDNDRGDIWIMNKDGSKKTQLTDSADTGACYNHPTPHPTGKYIAYWSDEGMLDSINPAARVCDMRIWMMTADGKYRGVVMDNSDLDPCTWRQLKFNPNGTKLLFTGMTDSYEWTQNLYTLNLDTHDDDGDLLMNWEEEIYGTDMDNRDTDGGGELDSSEINAGRNPLDPTDDRMVFIRRR